MTLDELATEAYEIALKRGQWPQNKLRPEVGAELPVWQEAYEFVQLTAAVRAKLEQNRGRVTSGA